MAVDLLQQAGIKPNTSTMPVDLLAQAGKAPTNMSQMSQILSGNNPQAIQSNLGGNMMTLRNFQNPQTQGALTVANLAAGMTAGAAGGAVAGLGGQMAAMGAYGATTTPNHPIIGGILGAAAPLVPLVPGVVKGAVNLATGGNLDNAAANLFDHLSGGTPPADLNKINNLNVLKDYSDNQTATGQIYDQLGNNALSKGYAQSGSPGMTGVSDNTGSIGDQGKYIQRQATTGSIIDLTPTKDSGSQLNTAPLQNVSSDTAEMIKNYYNSPTYQNAHDLQSQLGQEAASIKAGGNATPAQLDTAQTLNNTRDLLRQDIVNTFNNNGDSDLAQMYQKATNQYRQTVVPYMETPQIWNAINGKRFPNISNVLSGDDIGGEGHLDFIRNQLSQNTSAGNSMLAQALKASGKQDYSNSYDTDAEDLLTRNANLPSNLRDLVPQETKGLFNQLQSNVELRHTVLNYGKIAGGAIGAGLTAHHFLKGYL